MDELTQVQLTLNAGASGRTDARTPQSSWFESLARAWGAALDQQADRVIEAADKLNAGDDDSPADIAMVSAQSLRMQFLANSQHTSLTSIGSSLETMARKQ